MKRKGKEKCGACSRWAAKYQQLQEEMWRRDDVSKSKHEADAQALSVANAKIARLSEENSRFMTALSRRPVLPEELNSAVQMLTAEVRRTEQMIVNAIRGATQS